MTVELKLTLALHTLREIQSLKSACRDRWLTQQTCVGKSRRCLTRDTRMLLVRSGDSASSRGSIGGLRCEARAVHLRQYFARLQLQQTTAPSSPATRQLGAQHSSPHAHLKAKFRRESWGGGEQQRSLGDACPEAWRVDTRQAPLSIPSTSLSALLCALRSISRRGTRRHATSLAYSTEWADRVTAYSRHDADCVLNLVASPEHLLRCKLYYPSQW